MPQHNLRALVAAAEFRLATGPHPERARMDAEALLLHLLRRDHPECNRAWLIAHAEEDAGNGAELQVLVQRRLSGEPIQYIFGEAEFYGLPFTVSPDVLIPRPETEHLVEKILLLASQFSSPRIVDIGTGSGAIAVTLAHHLPAAQITATDISTAALEVARRNAERNNVASRMRFLEGSLLAPVESEQFEMIASNPPYVSLQDRDTLSVEVRDFEPSLALFAGFDGFGIYRTVIPAAFRQLVSGGYLVLEIGYSQTVGIRELLADAGFQNIEFVKDLQGIPRVAIAQRV